MRVLVDASVWSEALRQKNDTVNPQVISELKELIFEHRVVIIGPVIQELLSGIKDENYFNILKDKLSAFEMNSIQRIHHEYAAECFNFCKTNGVQGSQIDFLICAYSVIEDLAIFTLDNDYKNYNQYLPINLHSLRTLD